MIEYEEWRDVVGYEGLYRVSNCGRVWSQPRKSKAKPEHKNGHILPQGTVTARGHTRPVVSLSRSGDHQRPPVCKLVTRAFFGPMPSGLQVRHLDGNPFNNHLSNLRYGTGSENQMDSVRHGTQYSASKVRCKRNHLLTEPNLAPWGKGRMCLSCCRAMDRAKRARHRGVEFSVREMADSIYLELMHLEAAS